MRDLQAIAASYERIDSFLGDLRDKHDAAGKTGERDRIAREQEINEQAYFVLAWGQLEDDIDEACRGVIREGRSHENWRHRRAWSLHDPENLRLGFRNRLTLILDRDSDEWARTMELYEIRNQIAHGELQSEGIDVSAVIQDFFRIQSSLTRN